MAEPPSVFKASTQAWVERNVRIDLETQVFQPASLEALIQTKLYIPQAQPSWIDRPRLVTRLQEGVERSLTLLSAPPGFGKTTLLSEWVSSGAQNARGMSLPVAWLTLDKQDNDPTRFGMYLLAALAPLGIRLDANLLASVNAAPQPFEALLIALSNQIFYSVSNLKTGLHKGFVLVLDDYHWVTVMSIQQGLAFLLTHLPPGMHLVIATRADPQLPLAQLRAQDQLLELRANDLRFHPAEARAFLQEKMNLDLPGAALDLLEARTEGWVAGLQLAALAMKKETMDGGRWTKEGSSIVYRLSSVVKEFAGSHRYIIDYLADQVLDQQPGPVQHFLLYTSILERLSASLCEAILLDDWRPLQAPELPDFQLSRLKTCQEMLEYLERANLFLVALDDERQWYRYHPLFASFLQERLRRTQPERWLELHRRAAEEYERGGLVAEAVNHILAAGNNHQAVQMIEAIAEEIWMGGEMTRLLGWLEALPEDLVHAHPRLCIYHAWILNILGEFEATGSRLQAAQAALENDVSASAASQAVTRGMLSATQAIVALMEGEIETAIELSQQALEHLPADHLVWRSVAMRNLANAYLLSGQTTLASQSLRESYEISRLAGNLYMSVVCLYELAELQIVQGQLHSAYHTCFQALELAAREGSPGFTLIGAVHVGLSEILREWNELERGISQVQAGIDLGVRGRSLGIQVCGYTRLGLLKQALGDQSEAAEAFRRASALAPIRRRTSFIAHHDIQASLWGRQANRPAALHWARENGLLAGMEPAGELNYRNETAHLALVRVFLAIGRAEEAFDLSERLVEAAGRTGRTGRLIEILALQSVALNSVGRRSEAMETLRQALVLAEPEGYVRVFVDEGDVMRSMLFQVGRLQVAGSLKDYVEKLIAAFDQPGETIINAVRRLSPQEKTVTVNRRKEQPATPLDPLSERELEVLRLVAAGLKNGEIADRLFVAPSTIHWHVKNIYSKLGVHSRTQAVARATDLRILE